MKLLAQYPFDKITVKDIVEDCGVNRNTFYYHYHDIYALLEDILNTDSMRILDGHSKEDSFSAGIKNVAALAIQNKTALYHLYNSINRRQVDAYLSKATGEFLMEYFHEKLNGREVNEEDLQFICDFYRCAVVGRIIQWLDGGMKEDPDYVINKLEKLVDGTFEHMLENID